MCGCIPIAMISRFFIISGLKLIFFLFSLLFFLRFLLMPFLPHVASFFFSLLFVVITLVPSFER